MAGNRGNNPDSRSQPMTLRRRWMAGCNTAWLSCSVRTGMGRDRRDTVDNNKLTYNRISIQVTEMTEKLSNIYHNSA